MFCDIGVKQLKWEASREDGYTARRRKRRQQQHVKHKSGIGGAGGGKNVKRLKRNTAAAVKGNSKKQRCGGKRRTK